MSLEYLMYSNSAFQRLCTSLVPLRSTGMPIRTVLALNRHEQLGWPDTCPMSMTVVDMSCSPYITVDTYAFTHTNQHSGEHFKLRIDVRNSGRWDADAEWDRIIVEFL